MPTFRALISAAALAVLVPQPAFAANPSPPTVAITSAAAVSQTTATFRATVNPNGAQTNYRFEYGTTPSYGLVTETATVPAGDDVVSVTVPVTGLTASTTYHVRVSATNAAGTVESADVTLKTAAVPVPAVSTSSPRDVGATTMTMVARVNPRAQATSVAFEYGPTNALGTSSSAVTLAAGSATVQATVALTGLRPNTRYFFRALATNATGSARGGIRSTVTSRGLGAIEMGAVAAATTWNGSAVISGRVTGASVSNTPLALQRADFPFLTGFREVGRANADHGGAFRFSAGPLFSAIRLRVVTRTSPVLTGPVVEVQNRVHVGVRLAGGRRRSVVLAGVTNPAITGGHLAVQRKTADGRWVRLRTVKPAALDGARSRYRISVRRGQRISVVRVVALPAAGAANVRGVSRELRVPGRRSR